MAIAKVFKNRVLNCHVSTPEGRLITFVAGHHITTVKKDIDFLEKEIAEGNNEFLYVDPNELEVDTEELSEEGRINKIKRLAIEEYLKNQAASSSSTSAQGEIGAGTSATVNPPTIDTVVSTPKDSASEQPKAVEAPVSTAKIVPGSAAAKECPAPEVKK